jgi:Tol biopolymer transport system component
MKTITTLLAMLLYMASSMAQSASCHNFWSVVSPDGKYIYFSSTRDGGDYQIFRSDIDGISHLTKLTNSTGNKFYPAISPDGSKIAFQSGDYGAAAEIFIMNSDGTSLKQLTNNSGFDGYPNFSPDGKKIIFSAWDASPYPEIFTMDIDGSNLKQITNKTGAFWQSAAKYNPAGTKIYFQAGFNADDHIVMMDLDGSNWVDITPPNSFGYTDANLFFSPDGKTIIFYNTDNKGYSNGGDLVIANADGTNWNTITNAVDKEYFYQACYHPSNGKLYFTYITTNLVNEIHEMKIDGTADQKISNCAPLGSEDINTNKYDITLFPNPADGQLTVNVSNMNNRTLQIMVYNALGNLIDNQFVTGIDNNLQINTIGWPAGIYFMDILDGSEHTTKKIVIAH